VPIPGVEATSAPPQMQSLQILRAVAASSVVYYHIGRPPVFGTFGVDLFFVLSGFVIAMIAGNSSAGVFAVNRITRVVPMYWILTSAILVLAIVAPNLLTATTANAADFFKSIFFIPFFKTSGAHVLQPMLGVGWTLNYEMLFYALATAALLLWRKSFAYAIVGLVVATWVLGRCLPSDTPWGVFLGSNLLFEFVLGIAAWHTKDWVVWRRIPPAGLIALIAGLFAFMAYCEVIGSTYRLADCGVPSFLIVVCALRLDDSLARMPRPLLRLLVHVGDASYATYLSHLYCVDFVKRILAGHIGLAAIYSAPGVMAILAASLVVGSIIYVFIDKPAVKFARAVSRRLLNHTASRTA
jgi:exopolysaccharide production protein ExoZ